MAIARRVTIRDVAREAGVSVATVSYWLNRRDSGISPATAEMVARTADRLGYRPSSLAQGLRGRPTRVLGLIVPSVANPSIAMIVRGAEDRASEAGYSLFLSNIDRHWDKATEYTLAMLDRGVGGVGYAFSLADPGHPAAAAARAAGIRVAFLLPYDPSNVIPEAIMLDNETGMRLVAHHLWNHGHRRIAFATASLSTANGPHRLAGLRAALEDLGGTLEEDQVYVHEAASGHLDEAGEIEAGRRAAIVLLSKPNPPTAIVGVDDMLAMGILGGARELNLSVPRDVSVVGFDDLAVAQIAQPALTTLSVRRYEMGSQLADLLLRSSPPTEPLAPETPMLVARASTGPAPRVATRLVGGDADT